MTALKHFIDLFLHLDKHLSALIEHYGAGTYAILFMIVFCETGLVVTPILPGDSLLFAFGALAAREGSQLNLGFSTGLLIAASVAGYAVNYAAGYFIGPRVFHYEDSWLLNKKYLARTHEFYE